MNERFFLLNQSKQEQIINSGYKAFGHNTYKKASMLIIAQEAGISKSLLFHYFRNKQELYLFLYQKASAMLNDAWPSNKEIESLDLFKKIEIYMNNKLELFRRNPLLLDFINKVYFEEEESIQTELRTLKEKDIQRACNQLIWKSCDIDNKSVNEKNLICDVILNMAEGFTHAKRKYFCSKPEQVRAEFTVLLTYVKNLYYKDA